MFFNCVKVDPLEGKSECQFLNRVCFVVFAILTKMEFKANIWFNIKLVHYQTNLEIIRGRISKLTPPRPPATLKRPKPQL